MSGVRFEGELRPARGGGAYVALPAGALAALGGRTRMRVRGSLNDVAFQSNLMPGGGGAAYLGVHKATREAAGAAFGDRVAVEFEPDDAPRPIEVPPALADAFASDQEARAAFDRLAPSQRRERAAWVAEAKSEETRARRVAAVLERLRAGADAGGLPSLAG